MQTKPISHAILAKAVQYLYGAPNLSSLLNAGKALRVKFGVDPTRPDLHLGHAVPLEFLRAFQDAGHETILIIGDTTAMIGDPSGRNITRPHLSAEEIKTNLKTYINQAKIILDESKTKIILNSTWLSKLNLSEIIEYAGKVSINQLSEREDFKKRIKNNDSISLHEYLYPLIQAIDSIEVKSDLELGGDDQRLNLLLARDIQKKSGTRPQAVLTTPLLVGTDGKKKMSKSHDNYIALTDSADEMFGKVMSIPDELIESYARFAAWQDDASVKKILADHPRDAKLEVAERIVERYHDKSSAQQARTNFIQTFSTKEQLGALAVEVSVSPDTELYKIISSLTNESTSEAKRLVEQGGVRIRNQQFVDPYEIVAISSGDILQLGKKRFYKLMIR